MLKYTLIFASSLMTAQAFWPLEIPTAETRKNDVLWLTNGFKGLHDGYYGALYNKKPHESKCFNSQIESYAIEFNENINTILSFWFFDVANDMKLFNQNAYVYENIKTECGLYEGLYALMDFCEQNSTACLLE